jgi:hypothetical protein
MNSLEAYDLALNPFHEISAASILAMREVVRFPCMLLTEVLQRPDDAIHRGLDKTTELDMSKSGNFISNFEPLTREQAWSRTNLYLWKSIDIIASLIDSRRILLAGSRPRRRHHRLPEVHIADADAPPRLPRRGQAHLLRFLGPPPHRRRQAFQEPPLPSGCPGLANMLASRTVAGPDLTGCWPGPNQPACVLHRRDGSSPRPQAASRRPGPLPGHGSALRPPQQRS